MAAGMSSTARTSCPVSITGIAAPASRQIEMRAETKHAARVRIEHDQIASCIRSEISCGFYPRKPISQRIDEFAAAIFAPNLDPHRRPSQREDVLAGSGQSQQAGNVGGIRRFETLALHAVASEFQNAAVRGISDVHSVIICYRSERMRRFLRGLRQHPPNPQKLAMAVENLHAGTCGIGHIDSSIRINAEEKWAIVTAARSDAQRA